MVLLFKNIFLIIFKLLKKEMCLARKRIFETGLEISNLKLVFKCPTYTVETIIAFASPT